MRKFLGLLFVSVLLAGCGGAEPPGGVVEGEGLVKPWGATLVVGPFEVVVERPSEPYPSKSSDVEDGMTPLLLDMKATNVGDGPVPAHRLYMSGLSGGVDVKRFPGFVDEPYGAPSSDILPGVSVEWQQPIAVADPSDITLQIDYGEGTLNIEDTVFVGDAAE